MTTTASPIARWIYPLGSFLVVLGMASLMFLSLPSIVTLGAIVAGAALLVVRLLYLSITGMPSYAIWSEKLIYGATVLLAVAVFFFLMAPIIVIMPLSFNQESFFSYPMPGLSLKWYEELPSARRAAGRCRCGTASSSPSSSPSSRPCSERSPRSASSRGDRLPFRAAHPGDPDPADDRARDHHGGRPIHVVRRAWRGNADLAARNPSGVWSSPTPFWRRPSSSSRSPRPDRLRLDAGAGGRQPRRLAVPHLPKGHSASDQPRRRLGRTVRLGHLLRRGGGRAVPGEPRAAHVAQADVLRHPRDDQPDHHLGRDRARSSSRRSCWSAPRCCAAGASGCAASRR